MEEGERKEFISRIGTFLILIGITAMWLFIISDMSSETDFTLFIISVVSLVLAWRFKRSTASAPKDAGRFGSLRKLLGKFKKK
jgi:membrane protein implicated in regulation of membrane protease activity